MRVLAATSNRGKLREMRAILGPAGIELDARVVWLEGEETAHTYLDNALAKARAAVRLTGVAVLAEDAGIEIDALAGAPGPRSARFAGPASTDDTNNTKLLRLLAGVPDDRRGARYRAVAVLMLPSGAWVSGEGVFEGRIGHVAAGEGGFGYDPLFLPAGEDRTAAELTPEEKDAMSHRGRALRSLVAAARRAGLIG